MEDLNEQGTEVFSHHGVILRSPNVHEDDSLCNGTLSIVQYSFGKCVEWKPLEVSEVSECPEQDWSLVNTVGPRPRTISNNSGPRGSSWFPRPPSRHRRHRRSHYHRHKDYNLVESSTAGSFDWHKMQPVRIEVRELKSYKVKKNGRYLMLMQKDGTLHHPFYFQYGNANCFVSALRSILRTRRSARDRNLFIVIEERNEVHSLNNSFAELNLFPENPTDAVWNFMSNLKHRPYETTMETFSKLTDVFLYKPTEQRPEDEVADLLNRSLSSGETLGDVEEDYQMIPALPPRPVIARGHPLSIEQWSRALDPTNGMVTDPDSIKDIIFRGGVTPSLRHIVWKYLLGYYPWYSTTQEQQQLRKEKVDDYFRMKLQWRSMSVVQEERFSDYRDRKSLIEKDVNRTDRNHPFFEGENNANLALLNDILMTYVMYNFDLGYVQGMSDLLSPILILLSNEVDAFWCFVGLMNRVFRNFDMDQAGMKKQLSQLHSLLAAAEPELAVYLDQHDSGNMFFCFRWLLVLFKREFTHDEILRLWETIFTDRPCPNFHLLLCVAILDCEKDMLIENKYQFNEILKHVNDLSMRIDLEEIICRAESIYIQLARTPDLPTTVKRILGLESQGANSGSSDDDDDLSHEIDDCETVRIEDASTGEAEFERSISLNYL